ncbi:arginine kinase [Nephila pilipes]|uniref:arginine kinase n=1 Tax=Nephila pilipes TaxID=299642 RepID=A0A8X6TD32_NEPPI|nr:arginine kinase [Nephila pilipes]
MILSVWSEPLSEILTTTYNVHDAQDLQQSSTLQQSGLCHSSPLVFRHIIKGSGIGSSSKMVDQEVLDKLEAVFRKLQDAKGCKSLLKKHLTREVFDKLKNRKTSMGATLLDIIQSGTRGEHTESEGGVYDISNKRRMGLTEYQAVKEMQDGILELIKMEKAA